MNIQLQQFARNFLKQRLYILPERNQQVFKMMYSHKNMDASIDEVVNNMPADRLDWAMTQVQNSVDEIHKN